MAAIPRTRRCARQTLFLTTKAPRHSQDAIQNGKNAGQVFPKRDCRTPIQRGHRRMLPICYALADKPPANEGAREYRMGGIRKTRLSWWWLMYWINIPRTRLSHSRNAIVEGVEVRVARGEGRVGGMAGIRKWRLSNGEGAWTNKMIEGGRRRSPPPSHPHLQPIAAPPASNKARTSRLANGSATSIAFRE